ncbi:RloB family protein [Streptomyces sp. NPDC051217]|uniref:RloB family protein n=1 Tax=Streptomyces sp. NPDC051217 TaxID=3365644 RepID=UPI0037A8B074
MAKNTKGNASFASKSYGRGRRRVVHVYTEGKVTEPEYIRAVRQLGTLADPKLTVDVHIANSSDEGSQRKPLILVEKAVITLREKHREAKRAGVPKAMWPQVWCLFDRDQHQGVETALSRARKAGVMVAYSHPCFEIWRVLHLKAVSGSFAGVCGMAEQRLPSDWHQVPGGIKSVVPSQIEGRFEKARQRAREMNASHPDHVVIAQRDPYTNVHEFIEDGLGISSY